MQTMRRVALPERVVSQAAPDAGPLLAGFLGLTFFLGYELLMSGISKLFAGDFVAQLARTLSEMTQDQGGWYQSLVDTIFIPNAQLVGALVMASELALGVVFVVAAVVLLTWRSQITDREQRILLAMVAAAAFIGAVMNLNFHLAAGASSPWVVAPDPNDQGVDLDSLMLVMALVLAGACVRQLASIHRAGHKWAERPPLAVR